MDIATLPLWNGSGHTDEWTTRIWSIFRMLMATFSRKHVATLLDVFDWLDELTRIDANTLPKGTA